MPSENPEMAYIWTWLPGATEPVVAGRVDQVGDELRFTYGQSYLRRSDAIALQPDGLELRAGQRRPPAGLDAHGVLRDAAPDSWGMQVILRRRAGAGARDTGALPLVTHLLESGSNRIGALDAQQAPDRYEARLTHGTLGELVEAGERLARGLPFSPELDDALTYGTAIGGARPKAILTDGARQMIAKFSVSTDVFPWVEAEALGMELARRCGVDTAPCTLTSVAGRDVLLVERFDRAGTRRRSVLSALTLLGLHELAARHGTYVGLAERIRLRFASPVTTLHQLFRRLVVNVLVGNTDDHPRNHAAFWDGTALALTPAFDVCPQPRATGEAAQAMAFTADGERRARLAACVRAAAVFQLGTKEAQAIAEECATVIGDQYDDACSRAGVRAATGDLLWRGAVANESVFYALD